MNYLIERQSDREESFYPLIVPSPNNWSYPGLPRGLSSAAAFPGQSADRTHCCSDLEGSIVDIALTCCTTKLTSYLMTFSLGLYCSAIYIITIVILAILKYAVHCHEFTYHPKTFSAPPEILHVKEYVPISTLW